MPYNKHCSLWPNAEDQAGYFRSRSFEPIPQNGPHCVATTLAILSGRKPEDFHDRVNTQDPRSWSDALRADGMKLAYCPTDVRRLLNYQEELLALDDLFTLSYYTSTSASVLLRDPDATGWLCGSHIVVMHRGLILDPATGEAHRADEHHAWQYHTKRIFRVVPSDHPFGL